MYKLVKGFITIDNVQTKNPTLLLHQSLIQVSYETLLGIAYS